MTITVIHGDCLIELPKLEADSLDSCVCDPPYHLTSIVKRFGGDNAAPAKGNAAFERSSRGFMNMKWDGGDIAFRPETWVEVLRVLKPGAHLIAMGGTRTYHRLVCAIEDAGFEIRDSLAWLYAVGFPKSHDVSKGIDRAAGVGRESVATGSPVKRMIPGADQDKTGSWIKDNGREYTPNKSAPATDAAHQWSGWGTALKPATELCVLARKPLSEKTIVANVLRYGTGAINVDGCRVHADDAQGGEYTVNRLKSGATLNATGGNWRPENGEKYHGNMKAGRWPANVMHDGSKEVLNYFPDGIDGSSSRYFFTPKANSSDRLAKTIEEVTVEWTSDQNPCQAVLQVDTEPSLERVIAVSGCGTVCEWNTFLFGSMLTDLCLLATKSIIKTKTNWTIASTIWNALTRSLINVSTADVVSSTGSGSSRAGSAEPNILSATITLGATVSLPGASLAASQTQLTINVSAKRLGVHPTIKPVDLMRWLTRLVTPPGGTILDPFAGSGTTGMAAMAEGFSAVLIEREAEYIADIQRRITHVAGDDLPLMAEREKSDGTLFDQLNEPDPLELPEHLFG